MRSEASILTIIICKIPDTCLFTEAFDIRLLGKVYILGPPAFNMLHTRILHHDTFSIHFRFAVVWRSVYTSDSRCLYVIILLVGIRWKNRFEELRLSI